MPRSGRARLRFSVHSLLSLYRERSSWNIPDTVETFFDSRMDLLERRLKKQTDKLKMRAEEAFKFKAPSGDIFVAKDLDREVQKFKLKVIISPVFAYLGSTNLTRRGCRFRRV